MPPKKKPKQTKKSHHIQPLPQPQSSNHHYHNLSYANQDLLSQSCISTRALKQPIPNNTSLLSQVNQGSLLSQKNKLIQKILKIKAQIVNKKRQEIKIMSKLFKCYQLQESAYQICEEEYTNYYMPELFFNQKNMNERKILEELDLQFCDITDIMLIKRWTNCVKNDRLGQIRRNLDVKEGCQTDNESGNIGQSIYIANI